MAEVGTDLYSASSLSVAKVRGQFVVSIGFFSDGCLDSASKVILNTNSL